MTYYQYGEDGTEGQENLKHNRAVVAVVGAVVVVVAAVVALWGGGPHEQVQVEVGTVAAVQVQSALRLAVADKI